MKKLSIWGQTVVRNEENFIWFAIMSAIDYLDKLVIYDLGSTDQTAAIIKSIKTDKIIFRQKKENTDLFIHALERQKMLDETKGDWIFILDGDEIWCDDSMKLITKTIQEKGRELESIVTPNFMLLGDIYHYQEQRGGMYQIAGKKGHYNLRLINAKIPGLHVEIHKTKENLWREAYYDQDKKLVYERKPQKTLLLNAPYLHASFLSRSSKDDQVIERKMRYKYELGIPFAKDFKYPRVLFKNPPDFVRSPLEKMPLSYQLRAAIETPLKKIKRRLT